MIEMKSVTGTARSSEIARFCGKWRPHYLQEPLIPSAFLHSCNKFADSPCLVSEDGSYVTYAEVDAAATELARRLVAEGVKRDTAVGILFDRCPAVVVSMIAVHKAGGCYVPLDPSFPADRLSIYLEDSEAVALITHTSQTQLAMSLVAELPACPQILLYEDTLGAELEREIILPDLDAQSPDDLAYIMFTSGSTGRPKGVMVTHRGVRDLVAFNIEKFKLSAKDVFCLNSTVCFDSYVTYVFASLAVGGRLVVPGPTIHLDPYGMSDLISRSGITIMEVVPALAAEYLSAFEAAGDKIACLKYILTGGEALTPNLAQAICQVLPGLKQGGLFNSYGPTEVTVTTITGHVTAPFERIPLGRPDHNVHAYVVVEEKQEQEDTNAAGACQSKFRLAAPGEPGELWLSGPRLARGYRNRPEQTVKAFVDNCFYEQAVQNMPADAQELKQYYEVAYRTADLVVLHDDDHQYEYLGRVDAQIKINGVRMEISEVEAVLAGAQGVTHAAVKAWKDCNGTYRLAGYVAPDSVDVGAAEAHCRAKLLPAMVPAKIVSQAVMPRLPNGKIDVKSLPEPEWVDKVAHDCDDGDDRGSTRPTTDMEELVAGIWSDELKVDPSQMSISHNFFQLGGNSLKAGLINSKIRRATGVDISGLLIYQQPSVVGMAAAIEDRYGKFSFDEPLLAELESFSTGKRGSCNFIGTSIYRQGSVTGSFSVAGSSTASSSSWSRKQDSDTGSSSGSSDGDGWRSDEDTPAGKTGGLKNSGSGVTGVALPTWLATVLQIMGMLLFGFIAYVLACVGMEVLYYIALLRVHIIVLPLLGVAFFFWALMSLVLFSIAAKWLLIGRMRPKKVPIWSLYYVRWWLVKMGIKAVVNSLFLLIRRSEMLNQYYRALGAKIGHNVAIDSANICDWDLLEIGDDTVIETDAFVLGASFHAGVEEGDRGTMTLARTRIGKGCTILPSSIVSAGSTTSLVVLCLLLLFVYVSISLAEGRILNPGNTSARPPAGPSPQTEHMEVRSEPELLPVSMCLLSAFILLVISSLMWVAVVPSFAFWVMLNYPEDKAFDIHWLWDMIVLSRMCWVQQSDPAICFKLWWTLLVAACLAPPVGFISANAYMWLMVPMKRIIIGDMTEEKMKNGGRWLQFRRHLWRSLNKGPFMTTVYTWTSTEVFNTWLRALGAKIGRQCWLSEMFRCSEYELYEVADTASVCSLVTVVGSTAGRTAAVKLGEACDVTNDCTLMPGCEVGQSAVLGVFSYGKPGQKFADGSITLGEVTLYAGGKDIEAGGGSFAKLDSAANRLIPSRMYTIYNILYILGAMTVFSFTNMFMMVPAPMLGLYTVYMYGYFVAGAWMPVVLAVSLGIFLLYLGILKRVVMRDCSGNHPIFKSLGAAKWQMMCINCHLYGDFNYFKGSMIYNLYLRVMGSRVGRDVMCLGGVVAEYEQVTIGDGTIIGDGTFVLTHTVENRCVKIRPIVIGSRVTIGDNCAVLPDAAMEDEAHLDDMSLVMKGETVPRGARWLGVPASPATAKQLI